MSKNKPLKLKGNLNISRVHSNIKDDYIKISLTDGDSCIEFVEAKLSLKDFAGAITGLGHTWVRRS